jgi:polyisoprenyl-phosphate glycosyltransferase
VGGAVSFLVGFVYLIYKLLFWNEFSAGQAPIIIVLSFIGSLQLVFLGILGEYIGAIYTQLQRRPYAIERERVNFEHEPALPQQADPVGVEA